MTRIDERNVDKLLNILDENSSFICNDCFHQCKMRYIQKEKEDCEVKRQSASTSTGG